MKDMLVKIKPHQILILILLFSLFTRIYRLSIPKSYYFDEVYHAYTAKAYARNDPRGYEWFNTSDEEGTAFEWLHPPVSKLIMAGSISIFGENSFAWRLPSAIFGTFVIFLIYLLTQKLFNNQKTSLLAAAIASLDGLLLVQSRIAMNDIYLVAFMLLSLIFYLQFTHKQKFKDLILSGLFVGLSLSTKWSGLFLLPIIGVSEGFRLSKKKKNKLSIKYLSTFIFSFILLPIIIYLLSFTQFFLQRHSLQQFAELHNQIVRYQFGLKATHSFQSRAWQWPIIGRPVWYHVDYSIPNKVGNIYALSNPIISWFGLIAFFWFLKVFILEKKNQKLSHLLIIISYLFVWMPWLLSPRIMFYYHYTPAIPPLTIFIAKFLTDIKKTQRKSIILSFVIITSLVFILFYPHWTGIPMPKIYQSLVYWIPSWK
jgi:dolichyl-phosphate-mannose--protein O-mannosyl transferase